MDKVIYYIKKAFTHITEGIVATMLAAMFAVFLIQIFARYVLNDPYSWTPELCLALWVWIVFFGNAFIVHNQHQVTFDIFYNIAPPPLRKLMALISTAAIVIGMSASFIPTYEYIDWLKIKKSATLKIPMRSLFSIYLLFMAVVIIRYLWYFFHTLIHGAPKDSEHNFGDN